MPTMKTDGELLSLSLSGLAEFCQRAEQVFFAHFSHYLHAFFGLLVVVAVTFQTL